MKRKQMQFNAPVVELTRRCMKYKKISAKGSFILFVYYIKLTIGMAFGLFQNLLYSRRIAKTVITKPPVFILGHYRSGTTYLQILLSGDSRFGYLSNYEIACPNSSLLFGSPLKKLLQFIINTLNLKTAFFNNKTPDLNEPAEEERFIASRGSAYSDYWGFIFPLCNEALTCCSSQLKDEAFFLRWKKEYMHTLKFITFKNKGKQLVLKNPPNTERIRYLLKLFPDAKFIYIDRNPYHVFYSMRNLWVKAVSKFYLQHITEAHTEEIIFSHFAQTIDQYEKYKHLIPPSNLFELHYEQLEANPFDTIKEIYKALNLPSFEEVSNGLRAQLDKEKSYKKFEYSYDAKTFNRIEKRWRKYIELWRGDTDSMCKLNSASIVQECDATEA